ncbi:MAG: class I SAM-dependent rRNA methyltransferase [Verrucomicrobiales bacterium]|nr:class I SAM-dependent rRNA methyltransferase [Verrucomicrobiae bacterium]
MSGIIVNQRSRIFHGHEWVYGTEVKKTLGDPQPGSVVALMDQRNRPLGSAIYNPQSQIIARRFSRRKQELDADFFKRRIERAIAYREKLPGISPLLCRVVWSESDGLPGVIIDRYGDFVVLQTLTLAMDQRKDLLADAIQETLAPLGIVERNDSPIRKAEGMTLHTGILRGTPPEPFTVPFGRMRFLVDLLGGQKTGLYLDQLENYKIVAEFSRGRRVLDCFTNQGGFAIASALAGATEVTAVDVSEPAIAAAKANAEASGAPDIQFLAENAFDFLKKEESEGKKYDLIVLDPPSFTRNKKSLRDALRGYKEIHLRALKMLEPGGILATFSCSHHVGAGEFRGMICDSSVDSHRNLRQRATFTQRGDHPVNPLLPETEYLRGNVFEVIGAW